MEVYTQSELADYLRVHRHTIRRWHEKGEIPKAILSKGTRHYWTHEQAEEIQNKLNGVVRNVSSIGEDVTKDEQSHKLDSTQAKERG